MQLEHQNLLALLPPGHAFENRKSVSLRDVIKHPLVMRERGSNTRHTIESCADALGLSLPVSMELGTREAMREAVYNGFGIGFLFDRELAGDSRCVGVPVQELRSSNHDTLVCPSRNRHRNTVGALMEMAAKN